MVNLYKKKLSTLNSLGFGFLVATWHVSAQEFSYTYDQPGNLTAVSGTHTVAPSISSQPQSELLYGNNSVSFSVVATGAGVSYQWLSNGVPIVGATSDTLFLPNLSGTNGSFSVIVSNPSGSVTSAPAAVWADSNGNGIPDWWEMKYFGNLNQSADGDFDNDGVSNIAEYREGTNPANAASYNPRLRVQSVNGRVFALPDLPYYTMGKSVTLTAIPDSGQDFLGWSGGISGTQPSTTVVMNGHKSVIASFGLPLAVALDNTNLIWTTGAEAPWFGETEVSEDGTGAAQSGTIVGGQQSWLEAVATNLTQSYQLSFWWNVSSQPPDALSFSIDGTIYASISGPAVRWEQVVTNLPAGTHTLVWAYTKQSNDHPTGIPFADSGWVDEVNLTPKATPPGILSQPQNQEVPLGSNATFSVTAIGSPTLTYQWFFAGAALRGQTGSMLPIGAVGTANVGTYDVVVKNALGAVTSSVVSLTVSSAPPSNSYAAAVLALKPLTFWRLNETANAASGNATAFDDAGGLIGTYGIRAHNGFNNIHGPLPPSFLGFEANNYALNSGNEEENSSLTVETAVLNTNTVTIAAWLNPNVSQGDYTGIYMTRSGTEAGIGYTVGNQLGYTWNQNNQNTWGFASGLVIPQNQWSLVAVAISPAQAVFYLFNADGLVTATNPIAHDIETWGGSAAIGDDPTGGGGRVFSGTIDEVAVFKETLSLSQIVGLYEAGKGAGILAPVIGASPLSQKLYAGRPMTLSVNVIGSGTMNYQWFSVTGGTTNAVSGATSSTFAFSAVTAANAGGYFVVVSNQAGSVASSLAEVSVITPTGKPYEAAITNSNPVAYWRFGEPVSSTYAFDYWGGYKASYGSATVEGATGPQSPAFPGFEANNTGFQSDNGVAQSWVSVPALNLNTNTVTMLAWVYPTTQEAVATGLIFCRDGTTTAGLCYVADGNQNLGYTWNNDPATWGWDSGLNIPVNQWSLVALVVEATQATLYVGTAGVLQSAVNSHPNVVQAFGGITAIGNDNDDITGGRAFTGTIDEVAIYKRALIGAEIATIYSAATGAVLPPQIIGNPESTTAYAGATVHFRVATAGSGPFTYHWQFNGADLTDGGIVSGSASETLTLAGVQTNNDGQYTVVVNNSVGPAATSAPANLDVGTVASVYEKTVLAYNPLAYWRFNEGVGPTAYDFAGGYDGVYGNDVVTNVPGPQGPAFVGFEVGNVAFQSMTNDSLSFVSIPESLDNTATNLTITAWVFPNARQNGYAGVVFSRDANGDAAGLDFATNNMLGYTWDNNDPSTWGFASGLTVPITEWSLIGLVVTPTNAVVYLGTGGQLLSATNPPPQGKLNQVEALDALDIGADPADTMGRVFSGMIDEVSIFQQALTFSQMQNLYQVAQEGLTANGIGLSIKNSGSQIVVNWNYGALLQATSLNGPWTPVANAISPYTVATAGAPVFYIVKLGQP